MGAIFARPRKDGTTAHMAQVLIKRKGEIVYCSRRHSIVAIDPDDGASPGGISVA